MNLNIAIKSASPHTPSDLSRNRSDTTSTTSSLQARKSVTNPCRKQNHKSIRDLDQQDKNVAITYENLKNLEENDIHLKLMNSVFKQKMSSADALLMCRELNNIQCLNKETCMFQTENEKNTGEIKDKDEEVPTSNVRDNIINPNIKRQQIAKENTKF